MKAAHDMVSALCKPRGSEGSRQWIMSIPAREDHDPDLVITDGLMAAEKEIDRLAAENAELNATLDRLRAEVLRICDEYDMDLTDNIRAILNPEENENG